MVGEEGQRWRRGDGAELVSFNDYTGTLAFYTPDNHYMGAMSEREIRGRGYIRVEEVKSKPRQQGSREG